VGLVGLHDAGKCSLGLRWQGDDDRHAPAQGGITRELNARAITFQLAEVAVTGPMVRAILAAIRRLRAPPLCAQTQFRFKLNDSGRRGLPAALRNVASKPG
jgi:hypothetical protein